MDSVHPPSMRDLQQADYGAGRDYTYGSPHLSHEHLFRMIESDLARLVGDIIATKGSCRALEIGAGHGTFTDTLVASGASVTVTEMSLPSAEYLQNSFIDEEAVEVVFDEDGTKCLEIASSGYDLVVMVSVLHHIPDYLTMVRKLAASTAIHGTFYSVQDPTWYPDRKRAEHVADRGCYFLWRVTQGNWKRGVSTRLRRFRHVYDSSKSSDMVEYHVVRNGVDHEALKRMLAEIFTNVDVFTYWSTQSRLLQRLGDRLGWRSTFGIVATNARTGSLPAAR